MRAVLMVALCLLLSIHAQAGQIKYSDLSASEQAGINAGLKRFLRLYLNAVEIALYNIRQQTKHGFQSSVPMSELKLSKESVQMFFEKTARFINDPMVTDGFATGRGQQTFSGARDEVRAARKLTTHISSDPSDPAIATELDIELEVVSTTSTDAVVRLVSLVRPSCSIIADSSGTVHQDCH